MKILIPEIPKEGLDLDLQETIDSNTISSPVKAHLRIEKHGNEIIVNGDLTAELKLQCSRCLKDISKILSVPVDVVYHPVNELKEQDYSEIEIGELDMDFYAGEELDVLDLLKEQIELNIPMKALCNESCSGMCSGCGKDLNIDNCICIVKNIDPRFEKLKKLLQ